MASCELLKRIGADVFEEVPLIVRLPDGALMAFIHDADRSDRVVSARFSEDNGITWSAQRTLFSLADQPEGLGGVTVALVDQQGEVHAFLLRMWKPDDSGEAEREEEGWFRYRGQRIDIWHARTENERQHWQAPKCIWKGYTGALNSVIQLRNGRILLPFSYATSRTWRNRNEGLEAFTFIGTFNSVAIYSDDRGTSWTLSDDAKGVVPDITFAFGADEPVVLELEDGRVWMLMRTQMGRIYESFSDDGASWSKPRPSRFISSDSPAGIVRLDDGRIVLFWNNCLRFPYAYGGRQVIHAAISDDDGETWRGYREVSRDPLRNDPPPLKGDFGTAYPFLAATADNAVIVCTGQGKGRGRVIRLDPAYLEETVHTADFSEGLHDWAVFGTKGVGTAARPERTNARVLRIQRTDHEFPATAVWNFPIGKKGVLRLRLLVQDGKQGVNIGLTDHFSTPFDFEDVLNNVVNLDIAPDGNMSSGGKLQRGRWHDLQLHWDCRAWQCEVVLDGERAGSVHLRRESVGLSYLRLRSLAEKPEPGSLMVEALEADVSASWSPEA